MLGHNMSLNMIQKRGTNQNTLFGHSTLRLKKKNNERIFGEISMCSDIQNSYQQSEEKSIRN